MDANCLHGLRKVSGAVLCVIEAVQSHGLSPWSAYHQGSTACNALCASTMRKDLLLKLLFHYACLQTQEATTEMVPVQRISAQSQDLTMYLFIDGHLNCAKNI